MNIINVSHLYLKDQYESLFYPICLTSQGPYLPDPGSFNLIDRECVLTVAKTDPISKTIYLCKDLEGGFLRKVFLHELGYAAMVSYGLIGDIRRMTKPKYWIEMEEYICNFIADYGEEIFNIAYSYVGKDAIYMVPKCIDDFVA